MNRLLILTVVNLALAVCLSAQAFAGDVTALVGVSQFSKQGDGIWYQEPFPYTLNLKTSSVGLRYDSKQTDQGLSYSIGYMNLGKTSSDAIAVGVDAPGDGGYSSVTKACVNGCMPTSHWHGEGEVQGLFASAVKHAGPWAIEAGLYLYRPTWSVDIPDIRFCRDCPAIPWRVEHNPIWQVGPMLGLRYTVARWSLNASWWRTQVNGDEWVPVFNPNTYNLSVGYSF